QILALAGAFVELDRLVEHAALHTLGGELQLVLDAAADRQLFGMTLHVTVRVDRLGDVIAELLQVAFGAAARHHFDQEIDQAAQNRETLDEEDQVVGTTGFHRMINDAELQQDDDTADDRHAGSSPGLNCLVAISAQSDLRVG